LLDIFADKILYKTTTDKTMRRKVLAKRVLAAPVVVTVVGPCTGERADVVEPVVEATPAVAPVVILPVVEATTVVAPVVDPETTTPVALRHSYLEYPEQTLPDVRGI